MSTPALLVHGYLASPTLMLPMRQRLRARGLQVDTVSLSPGAIQDVRRLANQLGASVERALRTSGADQVDLVGVSQGGLIALAYAQDHQALRQVRRIVAVGSPFRGSWAAVAGLPALGVVSRGIWQVLPGARLVAELCSAGVPAGVERVVSVAMRGDLVSPPSRCALPGAELVVLDGLPSPVTHQWLVLSPDAARVVGDHLLAPR